MPNFLAHSIVFGINIVKGYACLITAMFTDMMIWEWITGAQTSSWWSFIFWLIVMHFFIFNVETHNAKIKKS